jgi:hypothetical protein
LLFYPSEDLSDWLELEKFLILTVASCDAHSISLMYNFRLTHARPKSQSGVRHDVKQNCLIVLVDGRSLNNLESILLRFKKKSKM